MQPWIWLIPATGPIFFLLWHQWIYRWAIFDGTRTTLWGRLKSDIGVSLPGKQGNRNRYNKVRAWIQKYARMEGPYRSVGIYGIPPTERFRAIVAERRYMQYQDVFLPRKWQIWAMMLLSLVWPVVLIVGACILLLRIVYSLWFSVY